MGLPSRTIEFHILASTFQLVNTSIFPLSTGKGKSIGDEQKLK